MVDEYDNSLYPQRLLATPRFRGGKLVGSTYLDSGDRAIAVLDVEDGSCTLIDLQPTTNAISIAGASIRTARCC